MVETPGSTSSTDGDAAREPGPQHVALGRIVGAHGLRGELRVRATGDDLENLASLPNVRLARDDEGDETNARSLGHGATEYEIAGVRPGRSGECRLTLHGVTDRDGAEALRGLLVLARPDDLLPLEPGEFYAYQLVGCAVEETDGRPVGVVRGVLEAGGRDLLQIETPTGGQTLVPAVEPLLRQVDLAARRIVVDPPPGLLEREREPDPEREPEAERETE